VFSWPEDEHVFSGRCPLSPIMLVFALDLQVQPREPQSSTLCGRCGPVGFGIRACEASELFPEMKDTVFINEGELVGLYRTAVEKRELSIRAFTWCGFYASLDLLVGFSSNIKRTYQEIVLKPLQNKN